MNGLIEINNDRIAAYETVLNETDDGDFKMLFTQFAATGKRCNQELAAEILNLGGTPVADSKTINMFFRLEEDIKTLPFENRNRSILNSCNVIEEAVADVYRYALNNHSADLTDEQQVMLNSQYTLIKSEHEQIKNRRGLLEDINV